MIWGLKLASGVRIEALKMRNSNRLVIYRACIILTLITLPTVGFGQSAYQSDKTGQPVINQSVSITDAVNIALTNNPMIAARKAATQAAIAKIGMAKSMTKLQVSAAGFATISNMQMIVPGSPGVEPQDFTLSPDKPQLSGNLMAMYPLYTGGKLHGQVKSASALQQAAVNEVTTAQLDVTLGIKSAYYSVLLQCKIIEAGQQRVIEAKERVRIAQEAYAAGKIAKYDLLRNQTELAEAEQMLNIAQLDQSMALVDLKSMMGISQLSQIQLTSDLTLQDTVPPLDDLIAKAVEQRSEVAAIRAKTLSAEANLSVTRSAYKPQIYATAMGGPSLMTGKSIDNGYLIGVTAAIPLLDGGQRQSSVNEAQAMIDQMRADERQIILTVSKEVAIAYEQLCVASKNVTLSEAAITQAEEDYRVVKLRYEAGKATNVEVLDALSMLTRARTNYAESLITTISLGTR
jgi:outer membrane protein TolC